MLDLARLIPCLGLDVGAGTVKRSPALKRRSLSGSPTMLRACGFEPGMSMIDMLFNCGVAGVSRVLLGEEQPLEAALVANSALDHP